MLYGFWGGAWVGSVHLGYQLLLAHAFTPSVAHNFCESAVHSIFSPVGTTFADSASLVDARQPPLSAP